MSPSSDDPIRQEVERTLHTIVDLSLAGPLALLHAAQSVQRCVGRRAARARRRITEPLTVVWSLFDLAGARDQTAAPAREVAAAAASRASAARAPAPAAEPDGELPIEEYESLAASQVVARLPSLTAAELDEVRRFEAAHRGRRTVIGRIDQLLVSS